jgi:serine/threonine protein kinase
LLAYSLHEPPPNDIDLTFSETDNIVQEDDDDDADTSNATRENPTMAQGYYDKFFIQETRLGRGARGSVYYVKHILNNIPLGHFAIKIIPVGKSQDWLVRMLKEVELLEKLHHGNIVDYKHAWIETRRLTRFGGNNLQGNLQTKTH